MKRKKKIKIKKKNILLFASISLIILIFAGIFLFKYFEQDKREIISYNGFTFEKKAGLWFTEWVRQDNQPFVIPFHFNPKQVEDIPLEGRISEDFEQGTIYLTFDPESSDLEYIGVAFSELSFSLVQVFEILPVAACTKNSSECVDRPIVTCEDFGKAVIHVKQSDKPRLILKANCAVVEGSGLDIIRATDRLLFGMYNIMQR